MAAIDLATVNAAIVALIANPQVDYSIGNKRFSSGQKMTQLLAVRRHLYEFPDAIMGTFAFDFSIDEFGIDTTQVEA